MDERSPPQDSVDLVRLQVADHVEAHARCILKLGDGLDLANKLLGAIFAEPTEAGGDGGFDLLHPHRLGNNDQVDIGEGAPALLQSDGHLRDDLLAPSLHMIKISNIHALYPPNGFPCSY